MSTQLARRMKRLSSCQAWIRKFSTESNRGVAARITPRWYTGVQVAPGASEGEFVVQLDRRTLQTPARRLLAIPSLPLALAIAAEWQWQDTSRLRPFTMPLMSLAASAIDQPKERGAVIDTLLRYLHTDALLCRHDTGSIAERQKQLYEPLVCWARKEFHINFAANDSIFGAQQSEESVTAVRQYLGGLSSWDLVAVDSLAGTTKSLLTGLAVYKGRLGVEEAILLARLEEDIQLEEWGYVEGGHDIDVADIRVRIAATSIFARLLAEQRSIPEV